MLDRKGYCLLCFNRANDYKFIRLVRALFYATYNGRYFSSNIDYTNQKGYRYVYYDTEVDTLFIKYKGFSKKEVDYMFTFVSIIDKIITDQFFNKIDLLHKLSRYKPYNIYRILEIYDDFENYIKQI